MSELELGCGLSPFSGAAVLIGAAAVAAAAGALLAARGRRFAVRLAAAVCCAVAAAGPTLVLLQPTAVESSSRSAPPRIAVLVDRSASMREADLPAGGARWEIAARLLADGSALRELLDRRCRTETFEFDGSVRPLPPGALTELPIGGATDVVGALERALARPGPGPLAGVAVITDGRVTRGIPLAARAGELAAARVPVWVVGAGDEEAAARPRLSVPVLDVPESAVLGETVRVEATVRAVDMTGRRVTVRLLADGREVASQQFEVSSADARLPASFKFEARPAGVQRLELVAEETQVPGGAAGGPAKAARAGRYLVVRGRPLRILYAEGRLDWGYREMTASLGAAPRTEVDVWTGFVLDPERGAPAAGLDLASRLAGFDVVVLSAVGAKTLEERSLFALARAVREDGLGLLLCPSPEEAASFADSPLDALLPAGGNWSRTGAERRRVALAAGTGERPEVLRLDPSGAADHRMWSCLPETHSDWVPGTLRPGVRVLLQAGADPALVAWQAGRGRVATMAWPDHWRWARSGEAGTDGHRRLFSRLAAWLGGREGEGGGRLALTLSRYRAAPGEELSLLAVVTEMPREEGSLRLAAVVSGPDGAGQERAMAPVGPGCYRIALPAGGPGEYRVSVAARAGASDWASGEQFFSVEAPTGETSEVEPDFAALRRLAADSGGAFLPAAEAESLAAAIAPSLPEPVGRVRRSRRPLWDSAWLMGLSLAALCAGWWMVHRDGAVGR